VQVPRWGEKRLNLWALAPVFVGGHCLSHRGSNPGVNSHLACPTPRLQVTREPFARGQLLQSCMGAPKVDLSVLDTFAPQGAVLETGSSSSRGSVNSSKWAFQKLGIIPLWLRKS
jgi:hypothetical protein